MYQPTLLILLGIIIGTLVGPDLVTTEKSNATISTTAYSTEENIDSTTIISTTTFTVNDCENSETNCTQLNTTEIPTADVKNNTKVNITKNVKNKVQQAQKHRVGPNICTCNLLANVCDINCCCDPDCTLLDKTIFKYCQLDKNKYFDDRYCNYMEYIYVNNTSIEWEVNQDGLFCVISSNLPKSRVLQREDPFKSADEGKPKVHFWHDTYLHAAVKKLPAKRYGFGDPIKIVTNDSSIHSLRIPKNLMTRPCVYGSQVSFLQNDETVCGQVNIGEDNSMLSFTTFFKDFKVIGNPNSVNLTKIKGKLFYNCPKNTCIEIEPKLCDIHLNNCSKLENSSQTKFHCTFDIRSNINSCYNAIKKIHYKFYHNGTNGIIKAEVLGLMRNFSHHFGGDDFEFIQEYSLEFLWINQRKNYSEIFSGNPGYIVGKPILIGMNVTKGNTSVIQRNPSNFLENFLAFPQDTHEGCIRNANFNVPLEFGYNTKTKCVVHKRVTYNASQNATDICRSIQSAIFHIWGVPKGANISLAFGLFGNAYSGSIEDWNEILYRVHPNTVFNNTQGKYVNKNTTIVCYNFTTLLDIDIFYSRIDFETVLNQNKILGIIFSFKNFQTRSYNLEKKKGNVSFDIEFELVNQVSFYDYTSRKEKRFVDPPSLNIRLPYDFFYPFIKIGSGTHRINPQVFFIGVACVLSVLF